MSFMFTFLFKHTATTKIYTLSLHDALPISEEEGRDRRDRGRDRARRPGAAQRRAGDRARRQVLPAARHRRHGAARRSEEHTSELQSQSNLVCRLLLEKKNQKNKHRIGVNNG